MARKWCNHLNGEDFEADLLLDALPVVECPSLSNSSKAEELKELKMNVLFLLFVIAILLVLIFWELSKINSRLKKTLVPLPDAAKDKPRSEP
jgi:hypothetical protein